MQSIDEIIEFINGRFTFHTERANGLASKNPHASKLHETTATKHKKIIEYLESLKPNVDSDLFSINPLDLDDLDDDIVSELSLSDTDRFDAHITELLKIADRPLDLNEFIVGCARKYNVKYKRTQLTARMHKLVSKGLIDVVGKGRYKLIEDAITNSDIGDGDINEA